MTVYLQERPEQNVWIDTAHVQAEFKIFLFAQQFTSYPSQSCFLMQNSNPLQQKFHHNKQMV